MKKLRLVFGIAMLSLSLCLAGCSSEKQPTDGDENDVPPSAQEEVNKEEAVLVKSAALPDMSGWSEVSRYTGDVDGDGTDENVVLMTSAVRGADGEMLWDDGQNWSLYVDDREDKYIFLNEYVQLGDVYFEVADYYMKDGAEPRINVFVSTGAGLKIKNYAFDKAEKAYREVVIYDTQKVTEGGINRRYSSLSENE